MVNRLKNRIKADPRKVILQFLNLGEDRAKVLIENLLSLSESECKSILKDNFEKFQNRHKNYEQLLFSNYHKIKHHVLNEADISKERKLLIGAYFSKEYSIESAALFNPSIVMHPNQDKLSSKQLRFVLSLRATGEGHISSIEFKEGIINQECEVSFINNSKYSQTPLSINVHDDNNYECNFHEDTSITERVLFPLTENESMGMEDVRFVKHINDNKYYGTYTAYNGSTFRTQLIETTDFSNFTIHKLNGNAIQDKGMALFPRKIDNKYFMIGRQDGVSIHIMDSNNLLNWNNSKIIKTPSTHWDYIQLGNCGSPIETEDGWVLITHAVGPLRRYIISALLLDLDNPENIIGELTEPLIEPTEEEREGYVPNVVYSCGSVIHNENLIIPYAMSDSSCGFAKISINEMIRKMKK